MLQALVASLRDELISDSSIRQQQEVEITLILFYTASSIARLFIFFSAQRHNVTTDVLNPWNIFNVIQGNLSDAHN